MCLKIKAFTPEEINHIHELRLKKEKFMHLINEKSEMAKEDIRVFKVLENIEESPGWTSPFRHMPYDFENEYYAEFGFVLRKDAENIEVSQGLHSYSTLSKALDRQDFYYTHRGVFEATIPKGTRYFAGKNEDIVSEKLIVHSTRIK